MARKIHSISLTETQSEWLDEHPEVSLSQIAQVGLDRQKEISESSMQFKENQALRQKIERMAENIQLQAQFIDKKGLAIEYFEWAEFERGKT